MTPSQLATLQSMPDQFLTVWQKLGGKYASYTEADIHRIAFDKGITRELRARFEDYQDLEAYRAIGFFFKILNNYKAAWNKQWRAEKAAREQSAFDDTNIVETCFTFDQVREWMLANDLYHKAIERFEFVKTINGIGYWRRREKVEARLTEKEAHLEFDSYKFASQGHEFNRMYEPVIELGWKETLFKRRFRIATDQQADTAPQASPR